MGNLNMRLPHFLLSACFILIGCGSYQTIRTDPPGAAIFVDGEHIGESPATYSFSTSGFRYNYKVRAEMKGYYPAEEAVKSHTDFWGSIQWRDVFLTLRKIEKDMEERNREIMIRPAIKPSLPDPDEKLQAPDIETAKAKLRRSFEKGFISVEQLKRANSEMQAQSISRILKAFLEGAVDEKTFGELY